MKRAQAIVTTPARHRWELALGTVIIPLLAAVLLLLAWLLLDQFPDGPNGWSADTAVAMTAAVIGSSLTLWWAGGLVMVGVGALARKLRWSRVEGWARKLTPALMARTLGAVVGIHVVTFSSAHAAETPNPFWSGSESSVSQSQDGAPDGAARPSDRSVV